MDKLLKFGRENSNCVTEKDVKEYKVSFCGFAPADDPEIAALLKAIGAKLGVREGKMSAATDASFYVQAGVPIVIFACDGGEPHSDREWGSLKALDDYADFFTGYFAKRTACR